MKKFFKYILLIIVLVIAYFAFTTYPKLDLVSGFSSKSVASHLFIANRSQAFTEAEDNNIPSIGLATNEVNLNGNYVLSNAFGIKERKALYREGLGAVLLPEDASEENLFKEIPFRNKTKSNLPFPYGNLAQKDTVFENVDYTLLKKSVHEAFVDKEEEIQKTRSVLVVYKDQIIAEEYADDFNKESVMLGWSMTKSITSAVLGVLEKQEKVQLEQTNLFPEWKDDERASVSLKNLLNMNSGLAWEEDYSIICDVTRMLFLTPDMSEIQKAKLLEGESNNSWNYSSGTTNLLSGFIRDQFNSQQEYLDFWYQELIDKIGMHSMILETDFTGNYVGSSYGWATTRDWAKFGLLYLHEGNWAGEQIINKSWVDFTKEPTQGSDGVYGGHFWLNAGEKFPDVPKDMYSCNGFQGQYVFIIPSKDLVVVRTGLKPNPDFNVNQFLRGIISSIQ
ncbi:MAG: CubicO group peptidase (beta-lactamase class C family) [Flavobacteriaceae bacterium]|jgi:CubicO group peptidase (beta-lactamase class C family)|uniref:serine hydrolase domain-containing protein n=1 Tax=Candidatus Marifrigoribacter sp. Uisw_064 TaxID=3230970 RepID=UPI003AEC86D4